MKNRHTMKKGTLPGIVFSLFSLLAGNLQAQTSQTHVFEQWATTSATQNSFQRSIVRSKTFGTSTYYYVAGATLNNGYYDMMVSKMNALGNILWTQTYAGAGGKDDVATDVQIDAVGNVYVCGTYYKNPTDSNNAIIIKYNSAGTQQWVYTYNGTGSRNDGLGAMTASGNAIYAVGTTWKNPTNKYDMLLLRVDSSGTGVWQNSWNYSANLDDGATNLYVSGPALYVAGGAQSTTTNYKYALLKVTAATGVIGTTSVTGGTAFGFDKLTDIQQDPNGNIYVTGGVLNVSTGYDYKTEKFDSTLALLWSATYTGAGFLDDVATGLYVDSLNNVIVTGYTNTTNQKKNYATVKYSSSGTQQWVSTFNGAANGNDSATAIVAKGTNVFVTGMSFNGTSYDYYTIKYDASGNQKWGISWNSASNKADLATAIATDTAGGIIVTGQANNKTSFTTVRYFEKPVLTPSSSEDLNSAFWFTENRGQLRTTDNKATTIKYYNRTGGNQQQVYFSDAALSYVWAKLDTAQVSPQDTTFRVDLTYKGGRDAKVYPNTNPRENYENFFLPHIPEGCARLKTYDELIRPAIYTGIDVIYSSNYAGMKYAYVIKPGTSPTVIKEVYTGANSIAVNGSGDLIISTTLGNIQRPKPTVWEIDASGTATPLAWNPFYSISGDTVSFTSFGTYSPFQTLVIELKNAPVSTLSNHITGTNMEWSTHYGHLTQTDPFTSVRADKAGNSYYSGLVYGSGFPFQLGMQQYSNSGTWDFDYVKVNPDATCKFSTYCGGSGFDFICNYMDIDSLGFIYFAGETSSSDFPMASPAGAYKDTTLTGAHDVVIGKIDSSGSYLLWSTYYGGTTNQAPTGIKVTESGDRLVVIGSTNSANFPIHARPGAYLSTSGNCFIAEFDAQHDTVWSTKFGTQAKVNDVDMDQYGDIFIVGSNQTPNGNLFLTHQAGSYWDSSAVWNAYIARFNTTDTVTWCTAFGGDYSGTTEGTAILCNQKGVYVAGNCQQPDTTFPLMWSAGEYIDSIRQPGNFDMFLARFTVSGHETYCTFFGTGSSDQATNLCSDDNNTVYLVGNTSSYNFPLWGAGNDYVVTQASSAFNDGAIVAFSPYNILQWSTCFGGTEDDFIKDVAAAGHSKLFITGLSKSTPATYPWNYPNLVAGEIIDTLKTNNNETGIMARFDLSYVTVGMNEPNGAPAGSMLIFPNPTSGNLTVQLNDLEGEDVRVTVIDLLGQVLMDRKAANNFGTLQEQLDLTNLSNGVYLVSVQVGNRTMMTKKVVKQQ